MRPVVPIFARGLCFGIGFDPCTRRCVHAIPWASKSVKEKISEVADKVNKKAGEGLATAIETGEKATEKTKKTLGATTKRAKDGAERVNEGAYQVGQRAKQAGNDMRSHPPPEGSNISRKVISETEEETRKKQRDL